MLTALNKEGELITLHGKMRNWAVQTRRNQQFFCPICKDPLILKAGQVRIPHFSHRQYSKCPHTASEPESPRHLQGKLDLYEWCISNQLNASLEHYLPDIMQRADVFIEGNGAKFALEFQCTPISVQAVEKRSLNYLESGITPVWIVGGQPFHKRRGNETFELTEYHWSLTRRRKGQVILAGYEPENQLVSLLSHISPISPKKIISRYHGIPLFELKLPLPKLAVTSAFPNKRWLNEKRKWIRQKVRYGDLVRDTFLKGVYTEGSNPFLLSPLIGLPVEYMESFISHPAEWQFFIWSDCLKKLKPNKKISLKYVNFKIRERISNGDLVCRVLPLHEKDQWEAAVNQYFQLLEELFYFQKAGKDLYKMVQKIPWPEHVDEAILKEDAVFGTLLNRNVE